MDKKVGGRCKPQKKYKPSEIVEDLSGYEVIKDVSKLRKFIKNMINNGYNRYC